MNSTLAAVFNEVGRPFELRNVPIPTLEAGECLVRIECCTICGSDLHTVTGRRKEATPLILGHEIVGVVEDLVKADEQEIRDLRGEAISIGDRVTWSIAHSCHTCRRCSQGIPQKCDELKKFGHQSIIGEWKLSGGFAQHCHLPAGTSIVKISESIPHHVAAPTSCVTSTAAAVVREAQFADRRGDYQVLILGAGLMGLTASAMLASYDNRPRRIAVCDAVPDRLELAKSFGADDIFLPHEIASAGQSFDFILEMSGAPTAVETALSLAGLGGTVVLAGSVMPTRSVEISPESLVRRLVKIIGVHNYAPGDLITAADFLHEHHATFPFRDVVQRTFSLEEIDDAIQFCMDAKPVRAAITPNNTTNGTANELHTHTGETPCIASQKKSKVSSPTRATQSTAAKQ